MLDSNLFIRLLLTIIIGAILGLETETRNIEQKGKETALKEESQKIGGLRTYTVLALFGGVAGIFHLEGLDTLVYLTFIAVILFTLVAYILNIQFKKAFGLTTEIAIIITFTLGFLTTSAIAPLAIVMMILVILTFFLSQKRGIGYVIQKIEHREVIDIVKFGLVSLVVLPILPNTNLQLGEIMQFLQIPTEVNSNFNSIIVVNPFETWLIVVLISGINLLGYVLSKLLGSSRGLFFAGVFGGLISSTSTTISLAIKSRSKIKQFNHELLAGIALIANAVGLLSVMAILYLLERNLFREVLPVIVIMMIAGLLIGLFLVARYVKNSESSTKELGIKYEPFSIGPALKFVVLIIFIKIVIQVLSLYQVNETILVLLTSFSGLIGHDAPTFAFAELVKNGNLILDMGILAIILTNAINSGAKSIYSLFFGSKKYFIVLSLGLLATTLLGLLGLLF